MTRFLLSVFVSLACFAAAVTAQSEALTNDLGKSFRKFSVTRLDPEALRADAAAGRTISVSIGNRVVGLRLLPRDLRAPGYRAEATGPAGRRALPELPVVTFRGTVDGESGSHIRVSIGEKGIEGYIVTGGEMMFVEPAADYSGNALPDEFVVYSYRDVIRKDSFTCASELFEKTGIGRESIISRAVNSPQSLNVLELATEADFDFVQTTQSSAAAANQKILSILNMVEGLFENELNLTLSVTFQHAYETPDPFSGANADMLLNSFRTHWNTVYPTTTHPRDAAHLFTYKPNVRAQGYAFLGVTCSNPAFAYGLSGRVDPSWGWEEANFLVTSHEVAHNLGASHADTAPNCANSLMVSQLSGSTQLSFCSFSRSEVGTFVGANGSCLTPRSSGAVPYDFDGDRKSDFTIFRPSNGTWFISRSGTGGFSIFQFGIPGDKPVAGDFDGDGKFDPAVYRGGVWFRLLSANNLFDSVTFGNSTDVPSAADFDGDGKRDVAVFRPSTGVWHRLSSVNGGYSATQFGLAGDVPMPGDFDGDGKADITVFRPSNGVWYRINSNNGSSFSAQFGMLGDRPVAGDFDGDGKADLAVWRPSTGQWFAERSGNSTYLVVNFGISTDAPVAGDYDGDGKADVTVWRPSSGVWHRLDSSNGAYGTFQLGLGSDLPVQMQ